MARQGSSLGQEYDGKPSCDLVKWTIGPVLRAARVEGKLTYKRRNKVAARLEDVSEFFARLGGLDLQEKAHRSEL
jgi:hypothetical protein